MLEKREKGLLHHAANVMIDIACNGHVQGVSISKLRHARCQAKAIVCDFRRMCQENQIAALRKRTVLKCCNAQNGDGCIIERLCNPDSFFCGSGLADADKKIF